MPIALAGRVPVKVSTESGVIKPGDFLTASSIPGVAKKATQPGQVLAKALEGYSGEGTGKVMAFVNISWYDPSVTLTADGVLATVDGQVISEDNISTVDTSQVFKNATASATFAKYASGKSVVELSRRVNDLEKLVAGLHAGNASGEGVSSTDSGQAGMTNGDMLESLLSKVEGFSHDNQSLTGKVDSFSGSLSSLTDLANTIASASALSSASGGAQFASVDTLNIKDAIISGSLNVLGRTTVSDLGVTGNITSGLMTLSGLDTNGNASINTIGDLYLQNNGTGGINLFAGKMKIDKLGNMLTTGDITAKQVTVDKINITTDTSVAGAVLSTSAGVVTLKAGETTVDVKTSALTAKSLVFTTPDNPVALGTKKINTTTFRITVGASQPQDVRINWWLVN